MRIDTKIAAKTYKCQNSRIDSKIAAKTAQDSTKFGVY